MKRLFYIAAAAIAVLSACTKEDPFVEVGTEPESVSMPVFKATIEGPATKTTLGEGDKVEWESSDRVWVEYQSVQRQQVGLGGRYGNEPIYAWIPNSGPVYSIFSVTPDPSNASNADLTFQSFSSYTINEHGPNYAIEDDHNYSFTAIYPASLVDETRPYQPDSNVFPATQAYDGDNIGFAPMYYKGIERTFAMKNTASILAITVSSSDFSSVQSIVVSSDQWMNGVCIFIHDPESGEYIIANASSDPITDANKSITLICDASGSNTVVDGSRTFYICIPVNHYGYLQIDVTDGTTTKSMRTLKASGIDIERNMIYPINFVENYSPAPAYEYVDLGLSVKWATCNLGASAPEETGLYYQWGDTQGYGSDPESDGKYFDWSNPMAHYDHYSDLLTKYNRDEGYGTVDNKTVLDLEDDAAHAALGGTWRIPTTDEFEELIDNSTLTWTTINGMNGVKFQSKIAGYTDKWIFIPAAGYRSCDTLNSVGRSGYYWSSTLCSFAGGDSWSADALIVSEDNIECNMQFRVGGQPIRPVCE